jgi:hypothetical protein
LRAKAENSGRKLGDFQFGSSGGQPGLHAEKVLISLTVSGHGAPLAMKKKRSKT